MPTQHASTVRSLHRLREFCAPSSRSLQFTVAQRPYLPFTIKRFPFSTGRYPALSKPRVIPLVAPPGDHQMRVSNAAERPRPSGSASSHERIEGCERSGGAGGFPGFARDSRGVPPEGFVNDDSLHGIHLLLSMALTSWRMSRDLLLCDRAVLALSARCVL